MWDRLPSDMDTARRAEGEDVGGTRHRRIIDEVKLEDCQKATACLYGREVIARVSNAAANPTDG